MKPAGAPSCFRLGFACRLVLFIACVSVRADIFTTDVTTSTSDTSSTSFPVVRPVVFPTFPNPINLAALPHFNGTLPATVHAYGGQLAIDATGDAFYHILVLSERDPANDPLTFWFNGGPGSSSIQFGFFSENGPVTFISSPNKTLVVSDTRWSKVSNVVWVDQPVGTGFSSVSNATAAAGGFRSTRPQLQADFLAFIQAFYAAYPFFGNTSENNNNRIILTGESYAGVYIPLFARTLLDNNYPLAGVMVGDPLIDFYDETVGYNLVATTLLPLCQAAMLSGNATAALVCSSIQDSLFYPTCPSQSWLNPTDTSCYQGNTPNSFGNMNVYLAKEFVVDGGSGWPYDEEATAWFTRKETLKVLNAHVFVNSARTPAGVHFGGVKAPLVVGQYANAVYIALEQDTYITSLPDYAAVIDHPSRPKFIIYSGQGDYILPSVGSEASIARIASNVTQAYLTAPRYHWAVDNDNALSHDPLYDDVVHSGFWQTSGTFGFLVHDKAAHEVPYSKPLQALVQLEMFVSETLINSSAYFGPNARSMFVAPFSGLSGNSSMVLSAITNNVNFVQQNGAYYRRREAFLRR